ncbi:MAG TPA: 1-phosphofructokinase family hexose kinase [Candidatus Paceibacterota bacterium]|nr:1-phosphofructokinase family hexose kinase [Verrucomicrobiota bacterium]HSA08934.1 1-phosphofructokinase family hexose kinase [Candidatus Paceibacterota bacterium]
MILCIGTTPALQRVMIFRQLTLDAVNRTVTTLDGAGGKSVNAAKVLKTLGERPVAIGVLGGDSGDKLRTLLAARGIELDFVTVAACTRQCITLLDQSAGTTTELVEEGWPVSAADYEALLTVIRRRAQECRAVVMSGSVTLGGPVNLFLQGTQAARDAGALSVIDAQGPALIEALKAGPGLVKPNRSELAATVGRDLPDEAAVLTGMRELTERGAQRVVVTAGRGPTLACDGRHCWRIQPPPIEVTNPIGSGDAFTAGLVWRLLRGEDLGEACRWAAAVGAANALTAMPGEISRNDVERLAPQVTVEHTGQS